MNPHKFNICKVEGPAMSAEIQLAAFSEMLFRKMEFDGFKRKNKFTSQKKLHTHSQQLVLYTNKLRGMDAIRQTYIIRQSFPEIDRVIYYLKNEYFSSKWSTGRVWLSSLIPASIKVSNLSSRVPNGYVHWLDASMDIPLLVEEVYSNLVTYAYPFWERYTSPWAVLTGLEEQRPELSTWAVAGSDLFRLACYLYRHEKAKALAFCEQRMEAAQHDSNERTSLTQEVLHRIDKLEWDSDGQLLVPPRPVNAKIR